MASIAFSYINPATGREIVDTWRGDRAEAITAAARRLRAIRTKRGWIYDADESGEAWRINSDDMAKAGAAILAGQFDYSLWCAGTGVRLSDRTRRKYFA